MKTLSTVASSNEEGASRRLWYLMGWVGMLALVWAIFAIAEVKKEPTLVPEASLQEKSGSESQSLHRQTLNQQTGYFHNELVALRNLIENLTGAETLQRPSIAALPDNGQATDKDFLSAFDQLRQDLADLVLAVNKLKQEREDIRPPPNGTQSLNIAKSGSTHHVKAAGLIRNRSVTIRNYGSDIVVNPRLTVNGQRNWFDSESIMGDILEEGMSDREKAVAIWAFLKDNRYHGEPPHHDIELHDPVRFLNVYGYGFCDDSATNFSVLGDLAGLDTRVWGLSGHVVPEVYYDGGWHMLDPDQEVYYLEDDGKTIAAVDTLERRPDIMRTYGPQGTVEQFVEFYTTTENNSISSWYQAQSETKHTMGYILRPGESLTRSWDNWGLYFQPIFRRAYTLWQWPIQLRAFFRG